MQSGNGIDLAAVHQLLTEVAQTVRGHSDRFDRLDAGLDSHAEKLNELVGTANEHGRKLDQLAAIANDHGRKIEDVAKSLDELRLTVREYHNSVVGHGISLSQLEDRIRRIENHLRLDPSEI